MRITSKDVERAFERLCAALGVEGEHQNQTDGSAYLSLDCWGLNPVCWSVSDHGGRKLIDSVRTGEAYEAIHAAIATINYINRQRGATV